MEEQTRFRCGVFLQILSLKSEADQMAVRWVFDEFVCISRLKRVGNQELINMYDHQVV